MVEDSDRAMFDACRQCGLKSVSCLKSVAYVESLFFSGCTSLSTQIEKKRNQDKSKTSRSHVFFTSELLLVS